MDVKVEEVDTKERPPKFLGLNVYFEFGVAKNTSLMLSIKLMTLGINSEGTINRGEEYKISFQQNVFLTSKIGIKYKF